MSVDVVIVNWNGGPELVAAVASVFRFGGRPIVVDNASTDTVALGEISRMPGVTVIRRSLNTGFAAGCNSGAAAGVGDVVMLLNPDAEIVEGSAVDLELALRDSKTMVIGPTLEDAGGVPLAVVRARPSGGDLVADLLRFRSLRLRLNRGTAAGGAGRAVPVNHGWIVGSALAVRRADWDRLGGMDEGFFLWYEDVDFGARAHRAGGTVAVTQSVRVRHQGASTWVRLPRRRRQWLRVRGAWRYARRHLSWQAAALVAAAAPLALALGVSLDVVHWLTRRP